MNGEDIGDATVLDTRLRGLVDLASTDGLEVGGIVQVTDEEMNEIAKTMDFGRIEEPILLFHKLGIQGTVSPESDVFRAPWTGPPRGARSALPGGPP